jgi:hypothetical protein
VRAAGAGGDVLADERQHGGEGDGRDSGPGPPATAVPDDQEAPLLAVETDQLVPPSGNLQVGGQQVWLGPALAGRTVTIWADEAGLHG